MVTTSASDVFEIMVQVLCGLTYVNVYLLNLTYLYPFCLMRPEETKYSTHIRVSTHGAIWNLENLGDPKPPRYTRSV